MLAAANVASSFSLYNKCFVYFNLCPSVIVFFLLYVLQFQSEGFICHYCPHLIPIKEFLILPKRKLANILILTRAYKQM